MSDKTSDDSSFFFSPSNYWYHPCVYVSRYQSVDRAKVNSTHLTSDEEEKTDAQNAAGKNEKFLPTGKSATEDGSIHQK